MRKQLNIFSTILISLCMLVGCTVSDSQKKYQHAFSLSKTSQVYFASGNLQYNPKSKTWRFAEHSYDTTGDKNALVSADYDGWLDLFSWGANGLCNVEPYSTATDNTLYGNGHHDIADTKYDFSKAYNKQTGENWRMFTHDEIHYLLMYRDDAEKLFGYGLIDGIRGLFILPDDWQSPSGITFTPSCDQGFENQYNWYYTNGEKENYNYNSFTIEQWQIMQKAGAVFLPVTGMRNGSECNHTGISGHYWTSSYYGEEFANCLCLFEHDLFLEGNFDRSTALAVRLVRNADEN